MFLDYHRQRKVHGLFLSSAVLGSPDTTMDRLNTTARLLRTKHHFKGYIHLKVIPGAAPAAIEEAVSLASAVSLNIETPGAQNLARLSSRKDFLRDIVEPMKLISRLTVRGSRFEKVKQTTQFIVGAAGETDGEIVKYMSGLYDRLHLNRVYFSAYQEKLGDHTLTAERAGEVTDVLTREHRLYQVDFLMRKYGFKDTDIPLGPEGNLSLEKDPKELWALNHPEAYPVDVNRADRFELLKVPGLGPLTVNRILQRRRAGPMRGLEDVGPINVRLRKAAPYVIFGRF